MLQELHFVLIEHGHHTPVKAVIKAAELAEFIGNFTEAMNAAEDVEVSDISFDKSFNGYASAPSEEDNGWTPDIESCYYNWEGFTVTFSDGAGERVIECHPTLVYSSF